MRRVPLAAFVALVVATVGAFFVVQHLKVGTPLLNGSPHPSPPIISPAGSGCSGTRRIAQLSFYLQHRTDDVAVYIVDASGTIVRTLATSRHMRQGVRFPDGSFPWDGRTDSGAVAPDGTYFWRVAFLGQGRTVQLPAGVQVLSAIPRPIVHDVTPALLPVPEPSATAPGARIRFSGPTGRSIVTIYRTDLPGRPRSVDSFLVANRQNAAWDGRVGRAPAPTGTYLVGVQITDAACNVGRFPVSLPPMRGTTARAGVSVRYLAAEPPLTPVRAGTAATVFIDARRRPYRWTLSRGGRKVAAGRGSGTVLRFGLPRRVAAAYTLTLRAGPDTTAVPVIASSGTRAPVLVVLPSLTWQGLNPVDDVGDGLPNTLSTGGPVALTRVLVNGLPGGYTAEQGLLDTLDRQHLSYELTTDLALIEGAGPALVGRRGVVLAGEERWVSPALASALQTFVRHGGHLLSLGGRDSLRRTVTITPSEARTPSGPASADIFGVRAGSPTGRGDLITVVQDGLGIFSGTSGAFDGYPRSATFVAAAGSGFASSAETSAGAVTVAGLRFGAGSVIDVGLSNFVAAAARDLNARELLARLWQVISH